MSDGAAGPNTDHQAVQLSPAPVRVVKRVKAHPVCASRCQPSRAIRSRKHFTRLPGPWVDRSVTRYRIPGVKPGSRYGVSVRGVNGAGAGPIAHVRFTVK